MKPIKVSIFNHDPVTEEGRALRLSVRSYLDVDGGVDEQTILLPGGDQGVILLDGTNAVSVAAMPQGADVSLRMARGTPQWLQGQVIGAVERIDAAISALQAYLPSDGSQFALLQARVKETELRAWLVQAITSNKVGGQG